MRLVFIHGWGFDATFWNGVTGQLPDITFVKAEMGFLGQPQALPDFQPDDILIGHSLGFLWGMTRGHFFPRWIAINSFARFIHDDPAKSCVPAANLRAMRRALGQNPQTTLRGFHEMIFSPDAPQQFDAARLDQGLAHLEELDLGETLLGYENEGLILAAQDDPLVSIAATEYFAGQCRSIDVMWKAGGHVLPVSEPGWCAREIERFIKNG